MSDLQARFAQAQQDVNALAERPDNNTMLKLYALYKQATQGACRHTIEQTVVRSA